MRSCGTDCCDENEGVGEVQEILSLGTVVLRLSVDLAPEAPPGAFVSTLVVILLCAV